MAILNGCHFGHGHRFSSALVLFISDVINYRTNLWHIPVQNCHVQGAYAMHQTYLNCAGWTIFLRTLYIHPVYAWHETESSITCTWHEMRTCRPHSWREGFRHLRPSRHSLLTWTQCNARENSIPTLINIIKHSTSSLILME